MREPFSLAYLASPNDLLLMSPSGLFCLTWLYLQFPTFYMLMICLFVQKDSRHSLTSLIKWSKDKPSESSFLMIKFGSRSRMQLVATSTSLLECLSLHIFSLVFLFLMVIKLNLSYSEPPINKIAQ